MTIEEKCIKHIKENNKLSIVTIPSIKSFVKNHLGIRIKSGSRKNEIIKLVHDQLNVFNLNVFAKNLERFAFTKKDIITLFDISDYRLEKLVENGIISKIGEYTPAGSTYITYYLYDINSCIKAYKDGCMTPKKNIKFEQLKDTDDNIAKALYIINKSAKVSRDTKKKSYINGQYRVCNAAKTRSLNLYHLKNEVLKKLENENRLKYIGTHKQILGEEVNYLDLYKLGDYTFHVPSDGEIKDKHILESVLTDVISSEKKKIDITYQQAIELLERYSGIKATGTYNVKREAVI